MYYNNIDFTKIDFDLFEHTNAVQSGRILISADDYGHLRDRFKEHESLFVKFMKAALDGEEPVATIKKAQRGWREIDGS